jgi:PadR family transcriptional regulator PadR
VDTRSTQLLKGTLDMCLLATIARRPCYGYEMVQQLAEQGLSLVSEGSIYPLLSRLQHHGYIEGYLVASHDGPKRKYYRLLPAGAKQLEQWRVEWEMFVQAVEHILKGARSDANSKPANTTAGR